MLEKGWESTFKKLLNQYLNFVENGWESTGNPPSKGFLDVLDLPMILATFQKVDSRWIPGGFPKNKH